AGAPRQRTGRTASQQGGDGGAPRAPALGCYRGRQRRALADAEPAHRPWAASGEAGAPRVPAAAAASDETVACGEGAAAGDEKARGPEEVAAAGTRRVDSTSPIQLEASLNVADSCGGLSEHARSGWREPVRAPLAKLPFQSMRRHAADPDPPLVHPVQVMRGAQADST